MNTNLSIIIDKYLIGILLYLITFFKKKSQRNNISEILLNQEPKKIIISKLKGMGSIIQSTSLINALKNKYNPEIIYLSSKSNYPIIENISVIDNSIYIDDSSIINLIKSSIKSLFILKRLKADIIIDLEVYSNFSSLLSNYSMAKIKLGFTTKDYNYKSKIYSYYFDFENSENISKKYNSIAESLNCDSSDSYLYNLNTLNENPIIKEKYIVINPNASDLRLERRWEKQKYIELINMLNRKYSEIKIIIIGSKNEMNYTNSICEKVNNNLTENYSGKTSINQLINIISNSELIITNDSGPLHIALSVKANTICLFGPCSPKSYNLNPNTIAIYKNEKCSPCVHKYLIPPCKGNNICMKQIDSEEVLSLINI